jgi:hypothetical protein
VRCKIAGLAQHPVRREGRKWVHLRNPEEIQVSSRSIYFLEELESDENRAVTH